MGKLQKNKIFSIQHYQVVAVVITASGVKQKHLKKKAKILEAFCHYSSSLFLRISNFRMP
jgi:hypothetical protein